jgi:ABC-type polysaccharide/polyol phosphate transport system ATPase subunit
VSDPTLLVEGIGKRLTSELTESRRHGLHDIWDELRAAEPRGDAPLRPSEFWALRDISFEVQGGEALGIIGANGAGKSTLLRLLHGLIRPDEGRIAIDGPHSAMLSLGAPFSRVLSGRENIAVAAAIHGVRRADVAELTAAVLEFSELSDEVLDAPMFTYSAGMQLRLGYAIAAQLPAQLILIDEVVAVGDIGFQRKCLAHIRQHLGRGGSVVLVSHDLWMIQALCRRTLVLDSGRIEVEGETNHAISTYLRTARSMQVHVPRFRTDGAGGEEATIAAQGAVQVTSCATPDGRPIANGEDVDVELEATAPDPGTEATWRLDLLTANRQVCLASVRADPADGPLELGPTPTTVRCRLRSLPLLPGTFYLSPHLHDAATGQELLTPTAHWPLEVLSRSTRLDTLAQLAGAGALSTVRSTYVLPDGLDPPPEPDAPRH